MPRRNEVEMEWLFDDPSRTGIFTDFDGTLSAIVDQPGLARPVDGAAEVLERLATIFNVVGVVSGRTLDDLRSRLAPQGVLLAGAYGRERSDRPGRRATEGWEPVAAAAVVASAEIEGVVIERKGAGVAIHYRNAPEKGPEVDKIAADLAQTFELQVLPGRFVAEIVAPGPQKGDAIIDIIKERDLRTVLVAGDDVADVEAFGLVRAHDVRPILVAVLSEEAPPGLRDEADIVLRSPDEFLGLLRGLLG